MRWYLNQYEYAIDKQRRIAVPSAWRADPPESNRFVLVPGAQGSIHVLPESAFEALIWKLQQAPFGDAEADRARASIGSFSAEAVCDKQGRIRLTGRLMEYAGLQVGDRALLIGAVTTIQIWKPERWQTIRMDADASLGVLKHLSETAQAGTAPAAFPPGSPRRT